MVVLGGLDDRRTVHGAPGASRARSSTGTSTKPPASGSGPCGGRPRRSTRRPDHRHGAGSALLHDPHDPAWKLTSSTGPSPAMP